MFSGDNFWAGRRPHHRGEKRSHRARPALPVVSRTRVDKLTIASLEATSGLSSRGLDESPPFRMIRATPQETEARAARISSANYAPNLPLDEVEIESRKAASLVGGGSTPSQSLPTKIFRMPAPVTRLQNSTAPRGAPAGISVYCARRRRPLILDLRTVFPNRRSS